MKKYFESLAKTYYGNTYSDLDDVEQNVIASIAEQTPVVSNVNDQFAEELTLGQKVADRIAAFGGSWTFIFIFLGFIFVWISINTYWLISGKAFDPYPFILLNLGLSTLAAFQAPIIMMSQNRQAAKERMEQDTRYQIHLKMELEIMHLHEKIDKLLLNQNNTSN